MFLFSLPPSLRKYTYVPVACFGTLPAGLRPGHEYFACLQVLFCRTLANVIPISEHFFPQLGPERGLPDPCTAGSHSSSPCSSCLLARRHFDASPLSAKSKKSGRPPVFLRGKKGGRRRSNSVGCQIERGRDRGEEEEAAALLLLIRFFMREHAVRRISRMEGRTVRRPFAVATAHSSACPTCTILALDEAIIWKRVGWGNST